MHHPDCETATAGERAVDELLRRLHLAGHPVSADPDVRADAAALASRWSDPMAWVDPAFQVCHELAKRHDRPARSLRAWLAPLRLLPPDAPAARPREQRGYFVPGAGWIEGGSSEAAEDRATAAGVAG